MPQVIFYCITKVKPLPGETEVNCLAIMSKLGITQNLLSYMNEHLLNQPHNVIVIAISLVALKQGEFRVMSNRNAFIAKGIAPSRKLCQSRLPPVS